MKLSIHLVYAVMHGILSLWIRRIYLHERHAPDPLQLGLLLNAICLLYDNLLLGVGSWIGIGKTLATLSVLRFVSHAIVTPTLLWSGLYIAKQSNLKWAMTRTCLPLTTLVVVALTAVGIQDSLLNYHAYPVCPEDGVVRYTQGRLRSELLCDDFVYPSNVQAAGPPLPSILICLILLIVGVQVALAKQGGGPWLLVGTLLMLAASAGSPPTTLWKGNGGEVLLVLFMTLAMRRQRTRTRGANA